MGRHTCSVIGPVTTPCQGIRGDEGCGISYAKYSEYIKFRVLQSMRARSQVARFRTVHTRLKSDQHFTQDHRFSPLSLPKIAANRKNLSEKTFGMSQS